MMSVFGVPSRRLLALGLKAKVYAAGICFLAIVGLLVAIGVYSVAQQSAYRDQLHVSSQATVNIERANGLIFAVVMESRGIYMSSDPQTVKRYGDLLLTRNQELAEVIADWQQITREDDAELFAAFKARIQEFIRFRAELVRRANVIGQWAGRDWGDNEANRAVRMALNADLAALAKVYSRRSAQIAEMGSRTWLMTWLLPILGLGALISAGIVAFLVKKSTIEPLHEITTATDRIAEGKIVITVPHLDGPDEIGRLAKAVQHLQVIMGRNRELQRLELVASRERDDLERSLEENRTFLEVALNNMAQGLIMLDAEANIILLNESYRRMYKLPKNVLDSNCSLRDLLRIRTENGLFSGDIDSYVKVILARIEQGKPSVHHIELKDGRTIRVVERPMAGGGWVATHEDFTEQRHLQRMLERTERFLATIVENVREAIVAKDALTHRYVFVNRATEALFGTPRANIIGKTARDIFGDETAEGIERDDRSLLQQKSEPLSTVRSLETPGNGRRIVAVRRLPVLESDGQAHVLLSLIEDRTEQGGQISKPHAA